MIEPIYSAVQVTAENIQYFANEYDYDPNDFVERNKDDLKINDVIVTATINFTDPIDDQFRIRRMSHWIITETTFREKFVQIDTKNYPDLKKFALIRTK